MIVFYTYDLPKYRDYKNDSLLMLKISIFSVIRELSDEIKYIIIFSNNPKELKKKMNFNYDILLFKKVNNKFSDYVQTLPLHYRYDGGFNDENEHFRKIGQSYGIAHARTFLSFELAKKYKSDILYLDFDTGIAKGKGNKCIEKLSKSSIMLEPLTSYSILNQICQIYPKIDKEKLPDYINPYACRWNCGIMFIKYNSINLNFLKDVKKFYFRLSNDLGFLQSSDEWAVGLALFYNKLMPDITFDDISFYAPGSFKYLHKNLDLSNGFVHYMDQKNIYSKQPNWENMLNAWMTYFEGNGREPSFSPPNYIKKKSNEFIWGRFELI